VSPAVTLADRAPGAPAAFGGASGPAAGGFATPAAGGVTALSGFATSATDGAVAGWRGHIASNGGRSTH